MDTGEASERTSHRAFVGISVSLFTISAALTIVWVRIHVGDARDADARRLDDVDGVDAV